MSGDQLNALAFEVAFDVVCSFSRFNDDFSTNMRQLQYDLDNHFKGRKDIEVIHTGSSYEQLFLAHVSAKKLNTDGDHMIIQTNYIVQESGTPSKTVHTRRSEVSIDTELGHIILKNFICTWEVILVTFCFPIWYPKMKLTLKTV